MKNQTFLRWIPAGPLLALLLMAVPFSYAVVPPRAEVSSLQFSRSQAAGLESELSRPGTQVKVLLTHGDADWRAVDFDASRITAFVDGRGANLALPDPADEGANPPGLQMDGCVVTADGRKAVLTVWGAGIPANGVDELRVSGSAAMFCASVEEMSADRADIHVSGGETFNVQPFRVVTSRGDGTFDIELRCLKSEACIKEVTIAPPGGRPIAAGQFNQSSMGPEWAWRGSFRVPPRTGKIALSVRYLPISRVETVPFDLTVGLAFGTPPTNPVIRWLKRLL